MRAGNDRAFKVDVLGHFALLHSLSLLYPGEGSEPKGGVIQASDGFFYGTTEQGGYGGEIFRMDAAGNFTVIHRFDSYFSDGGRPRSGLIEGRDGFLYGTASSGGQPVTASRYGVVYRWTRPAQSRPVVRLHGRRRSVRVGRAVPRRSRGSRASGPAADPDGTDARAVGRRGRAELDRDGHASVARTIGRSGRRTLEQQLDRSLRSGDRDGPRRCDKRLLRRLDQTGQADEDGDDHGELQRQLCLDHPDRDPLMHGGVDLDRVAGA
jgi:uncharacterized repeat protein (TIGR03803 family)